MSVGSKRRNTGPDQKTRDLIHGRSGAASVGYSRCERCGTSRGPFSVHHRQPRSAGGRNVPSNLVLLCDFGGCHDTFAEKWRTTAGTQGWLVSSHEDPAAKPIVRLGEWCLLDDAGGVTPCPAPCLPPDLKETDR